MIAALTALQIVLQIAGRTIGGPLPAQTDAIHTVEWIEADAQRHPSPRCLAGSKTWSCWGVTAQHTGIVVLHAWNSIWWTLSGPTSSNQFHIAAWGRLIVISTDASPSPELHITFGRPVVPPAGRYRAIRLETASIAGARAIAVAPNAIWLAGAAIPPASWVEIASEVTAPVYLALEETAAGPASLPLHVTLSDARHVNGRVVSADNQPARGALVTVFRLIEPPPVDRTRSPPRRVLVTESTAGEEGRFVLRALGNADYEVVAWHAQLGRASVPVRQDDGEVVVRLRATGIVRGRVVAGDRPVSGVSVISVPDAAAFSAAEDMTDVKGGDTTTGPDGRFIVMAAPAGGGELRIGGGSHPVKRITLPRAPLGLLDVGDVDLGRAIDVVVVLDRDPGCALRAAGPIGRTGLQLVSGTRTANGTFEVSIPEAGLWEFSLRCGGDAPALDPSVVRIDPTPLAKEVRMIVR